MNLQDILAGLDLHPDDAQSAGLLKYLDLLERWNSTYNLTAVRDRTGMLTQHLADCLAVIRPLQRHLAQAPGRLLDVGSGGGLPGVVIAALVPSCEVTCIDAVAKKVAFIRQVAGTLVLPNLQAHHGRVEALRVPPPFDVVTSRAFASLPDFVRLTQRVLAPQGVWLAMKGRVPEEEIAALPRGIEVFHVEQLRVPGLEARRCLVWLRETGEVPPV